MGYFSVIKKSELSSCEKICRNLKYMFLNERSETEKAENCRI